MRFRRFRLFGFASEYMVWIVLPLTGLVSPTSHWFGFSYFSWFGFPYFSGLVSPTSHGLVSHTSHGLVSHTSHGLVSLTSHGLVSPTSHGLVSPTSHGFVWCALLLNTRFVCWEKKTVITVSEKYRALENMILTFRGSLW